LRRTTVINSLRRFSIVPLARQQLAASAESFTITKATTLKTLFSMPSGPKAFPFKRLLINLLISFIKILGLISSAV